MGYSTRPRRKPGPGACTEGHRHRGEPVEIWTGETVGFICINCYCKLAKISLRANPNVMLWKAIDDDGNQLPEWA